MKEDKHMKIAIPIADENPSLLIEGTNEH